MLKQIDFIIGNIGATFPIKQFYTLNSRIFNDNKIYNISLQNLFHNTATDYIQAQSNDDWIYPNSLTSNNISSFSSVLEKLSDYIVQHDIEQLIIFLDIKWLADILPYLYEIKNTFSHTKFTCKINITNSINDEFLFLFFRKTYSSAFFISTRHHYFPNSYNFNKPLNLSEIFNKIFNISPEITTFKDTKDFFYHWLKNIKITIPDNNFIPHSHFSPKVISYLLALQTYYKIDNDFDIINEADFLKYDLPAENIQTFSKDFPLRPQLNDAVTLSSKLSKECRQIFLKHISLNDVNYMPHTSKVIYLSLFFAEKQISLEKTQEILANDKKKFQITIENNPNPQEPILTIYTTSYNSKKYIKQCIESIAAQKTKYPFIHLISDDNSNDGTQELLREYAQKYPHIQLILRNHNDIGANYYGILSNLSTNYVAVCDADDFYTSEEKIEKQINFMEENPDCGLCFHPTYIYYENENMIKSLHPNSMKDFIPKKFYYLSNIITTNLMQSSSVMYRWKWKNGLTADFPYGYSPLDWGLNIIHAHNSKIGFINEPMSLYRRHEKAFYALTETNIPLHLINNCFNELYFIKILNSYTERKYEKLFLQKAFLILYNFYVTAKEIEYDKEKYNNIQKNIELYFPEYIKYFADNISKLK